MNKASKKKKITSADEACIYCIVPKYYGYNPRDVPNSYGIIPHIIYLKKINPPTGITGIGMSFSTPDSSTTPMRRKRTVSERITENGDPLVVRKKARDAAKQGASSSAFVTSKPSTASSTKRNQVRLIIF
jgi:hypothetical protein